MMKTYKHNLLLRSILSLAALATVTAAYAVPADPRPRQYVQPDGSIVTVVARGDERSHYYLSEDGYLLARHNDAFYYANVDAAGEVLRSDILASAVDRRDERALAYLSQVDMDAVYKARETAMRLNAPLRAPGLYGDARFPAKGQPRVLVVLVEYTDVKFTLDDPYDYFVRMLTAPGFSDNGATGSVHDFFSQNSSGQFDPQFDVYGPITLEHPMAYYGGNDSSGNDLRPHEMAIEACSQLDETIDFSLYDCDHNGEIDNIYIFYAGGGEATEGGADSVWPHSWDLSLATSKQYYFDGLLLERYACSNEMTDGLPDGMSTFVHEFSHVLGLPDLYPTTYSQAFTPGPWSTLDTGIYNNNQCTPPYYGAFERYALGWLDPLVIDGPMTVSLQDISTNQACIINTDSPNEYFLLENRQQHDWDAYVPGHGMLIWHIDYKTSVWDLNAVNNNATHQYVDIEEADNKPTESTRGGDTFPGTKGITSFTDDTAPSMLTWDRQPLNLPITDIKEVDGVVTFNVAGGDIHLEAVTLAEASDITGSSFVASWTQCDNASSYLLSVYTKVDGLPVYVDGWCRRDVGDVTTCKVTGLLPNTTYWCVVTAFNTGFTSDDSNEITFVSGEENIEHRTAVATSATNVVDDAFVANWLAVEDADAYYLNVYMLGEMTELYDACDFTGGLTKLPEGWSTNSKLTFANDAYAGESTPSLRLSVADAYIQSAVYDDDIVSVSFWYRGYNTLETNTLQIIGEIDGVETMIDEIAILNDEGGQSVSIIDIPAGVRYIKILFHEAQHKGAVAIDDIVLGWHRHRPMCAVDGFTEYNAGDNLSCLVYGLAPATTYYYSVVAGRGEMRSHRSEEVTVTTTAVGAGVADISDAPANISVDGNVVHITGAPGDSVVVYDVTGCQVSSAAISGDGHLYLSIPAAGVYIIKSAADIVKIAVR